MTSLSAAPPATAAEIAKIAEGCFAAAKLDFKIETSTQIAGGRGSKLFWFDAVVGTKRVPVRLWVRMLLNDKLVACSLAVHNRNTVLGTDFSILCLGERSDVATTLARSDYVANEPVRVTARTSATAKQAIDALIDFGLLSAGTRQTTAVKPVLNKRMDEDSAPKAAAASVAAPKRPATAVVAVERKTVLVPIDDDDDDDDEEEEGDEEDDDGAIGEEEGEGGGDAEGDQDASAAAAVEGEGEEGEEGGEDGGETDPGAGSGSGSGGGSGSVPMDTSDDGGTTPKPAPAKQTAVPKKPSAATATVATAAATTPPALSFKPLGNPAVVGAGIGSTAAPPKTNSAVVAVHQAKPKQKVVIKPPVAISTAVKAPAAKAPAAKAPAAKSAAPKAAAAKTPAAKAESKIKPVTASSTIDQQRRKPIACDACKALESKSSEGGGGAGSGSGGGGESKDAAAAAAAGAITHKYCEDCLRRRTTCASSGCDRVCPHPLTAATPSADFSLFNGYGGDPRSVYIVCKTHSPNFVCKSGRCGNDTLCFKSQADGFLQCLGCDTAPDR